MLCVWHFIVVYYVCMYLDMFTKHSAKLIECVADLRMCVYKQNDLLLIF